MFPDERDKNLLKLLLYLLTINPRARIPAKQALMNPFFQEVGRFFGFVVIPFKTTKLLMRLTLSIRASLPSPIREPTNAGSHVRHFWQLQLQKQNVTVSFLHSRPP
jgi:hypothetical protein